MYMHMIFVINVDNIFSSDEYMHGVLPHVFDIRRIEKGTSDMYIVLIGFVVVGYHPKYPVM